MNACTTGILACACSKLWKLRRDPLPPLPHLYESLRQLVGRRPSMAMQWVSSLSLSLARARARAHAVPSLSLFLFSISPVFSLTHTHSRSLSHTHSLARSHARMQLVYPCLCCLGLCLVYHYFGIRKRSGGMRDWWCNEFISVWVYLCERER